MANTIDVDLLIDTLSARAVTTLGARLAPLSCFTADFSDGTFVQTKSHQVMVVTSTNATVKNPTSFNAKASVTDNVAVTIDHYTQPFGVSSAELNQKVKLENLADKNLQTLAEAILAVAMTNVSAANFTNASGNIAQASLAAGDIQAAWGKIAATSKKNLLLDGVAFSKFLPTALTSFGFKSGDPAYGFDAVHCMTAWTGAEAGTYGFACSPEAVCQASGIPEIHPAVKALLFESTLVNIPNLGLDVQLNVWGDANARTVWASYDLFYGASFGKQAASGYRIKSS